MARKEKKVRIYSALEVANICGVVNQTAINWIKNGYLKAFTTPGGQYRVYSEDLISFLDSRGMRIPPELEDSLSQESPLKKILIVDDEHDVNELIRRFIQRKIPDIEVFQAFDGFEAGKIVAEKRPQIIVLDIGLPGIDGHKLCRKIKEDPSLNNPMVISITGLDNPAERDQILQEGADAFFAKPLNLDHLMETIMDYENRGSVKENLVKAEK